MVNILIAIVTGEYAKALESSASLFARARLESAARQGKIISIEPCDHHACKCASYSNVLFNLVSC